MKTIVTFIPRAGIAALLGMLFATSAFADPPKGVVNVGRKLAQFNVIAKPGAWDPTVGNFCNGARIFFAQDNGGANDTLGRITWNLDPTVTGTQITDCNGTDGFATVTADESVNFAMFLRVMGPVTSQLNFVCTVVVQSLNDNLCMITSDTFKKGNSFARIGTNIADEAFAQVLWDFSGDWKVFQVRLYELLP